MVTAAPVVGEARPAKSSSARLASASAASVHPDGRTCGLCRCPACTGLLGARHRGMCVTHDLELAGADLLRRQQLHVTSGCSSAPQLCWKTVLGLSWPVCRSPHSVSVRITGTRSTPACVRWYSKRTAGMRVLPPHDDARLFEPPQAAGQQGARRAGELGQVGEAVEAVQQFSQYGQRVTVAENLECVGQRAFPRGWYRFWTHAVTVHLTSSRKWTH